jgi:hypothetical protein
LFHARPRVNSDKGLTVHFYHLENKIMKKYTKKDLVSFAHTNNITINSRMKKAELEAVIMPFLINQRNNTTQENKPMQYILNTPNSVMSVRAAMALRLPTDDMHTTITTTMQSCIEVNIIVPFNNTTTEAVVEIDMDEAHSDAHTWYHTHTTEHNMDEEERPTPTKQAIDVFFTLIAHKHDLYSQLDTMRICDPKDEKYPRYAVRDDNGEIMTYNRNSAWGECLRKWDWRLSSLRARTTSTLGITINRDATGAFVSMTRGITTQPPTYTFTTTKGRVLKVVQGTWLEGPVDIEAIKAAMATKHSVKTVKVSLESNKRNSMPHQDAWYKDMVRRIRYVKAMIGTKTWDANKRTLVSNQDGLTDKDGHKAGYDYGKAARIVKTMSVAQAPLRQAIKDINVRLDMATELYGHKIWDHYYNAINSNIGLDYITGNVDDTCDDLVAHSASLNRGDDLSKAYQEEQEGGWVVCTHEDREEGVTGMCNTKGRKPSFRMWDEEAKDAIEDSYWVGKEIGDLSYRTLEDDAIGSEEEWFNQQDFNGNWKGEQQDIDEEELALYLLS